MVDDRTWTVRAVLDAARDYLGKRGVDTARLDAELLLARALGWRRLDLYLKFDRPLSDAEREPFRELLRRRGERVPVAYLTGEREFYGLAFEVSPAVLIPRPETELLVELGLRHAPPGARVLDLCTGSGCVAIALLTARPDLRAVAVDLSAAALAVARRNARRHAVDGRLDLVRGDLATGLGGSWGLVLANPPYVDDREWQTLAPEIREHEPRLALVSADGGLEHSARIAAWLAAHLGPGGVAAVECADARGESTRAVFARTLGARWPLYLERDLAGRDRVLRVGPTEGAASPTPAAQENG